MHRVRLNVPARSREALARCARWEATPRVCASDVCDAVRARSTVAPPEKPGAELQILKIYVLCDRTEGADLQILKITVPAPLNAGNGFRTV